MRRGRIASSKLYGMVMIMIVLKLQKMALAIGGTVVKARLPSPIDSKPSPFSVLESHDKNSTMLDEVRSRHSNQIIKLPVNHQLPAHVQA